MPPADHPDLPKRLLQYLAAPRPMVIMESIDGMTRLAHVGAKTQVLTTWKHPSPHLRAAALHYMRILFPEEAMPLLLNALADNEPVVRSGADRDRVPSTTPLSASSPSSAPGYRTSTNTTNP